MGRAGSGPEFQLILGRVGSLYLWVGSRKWPTCNCDSTRDSTRDVEVDMFCAATSSYSLFAGVAALRGHVLVTAIFVYPVNTFTPFDRPSSSTLLVFVANSLLLVSKPDAKLLPTWHFWYNGTSHNLYFDAIGQASLDILIQCLEILCHLCRNAQREYRLLQKSSPLKLFGIFSLRLCLFAWNFADLLAIYLYPHYIYQYFVDLS